MKSNGLASAKGGAISLEMPIEDAQSPEDKFELPGEDLADTVDEEEVKVDFRLTKYIKVFDDALPQSYCDKIIKLFREDADNHIVRDSGTENFVSCNIEKSASWEKVSYTQRQIVEATMPVYAKSVAPHQSQFPEQSVLEDFYVYQFRDENDYKDIGVDVSNLAQVKRYLTFIWFLTTDDDFEIGFFDVQNTVSAKAGRLVVFPSVWTYPYALTNIGNNENFLVKSHVTMV
jgi:hypothetical protein